jgi:hypothetical protein
MLFAEPATFGASQEWTNGQYRCSGRTSPWLLLLALWLLILYVLLSRVEVVQEGPALSSVVRCILPGFQRWNANDRTHHRNYPDALRIENNGRISRALRTRYSCARRLTADKCVDRRHSRIVAFLFRGAFNTAKAITWVVHSGLSGSCRRRSRHEMRYSHSENFLGFYGFVRMADIRVPRP